MKRLLGVLVFGGLVGLAIGCGAALAVVQCFGVQDNAVAALIGEGLGGIGSVVGMFGLGFFAVNHGWVD